MVGVTVSVASHSQSNMTLPSCSLDVASDRSSNSCFSMTAGRVCRCDDADGRLNSADFTPSSAPSSRSFRPTSCDVWKGSRAELDVDSVAASSGLVDVEQCLSRRRCSINGTALGRRVETLVCVQHGPSSDTDKQTHHITPTNTRACQNTPTVQFPHFSVLKPKSLSPPEDMQQKHHIYISQTNV